MQQSDASELTEETILSKLRSVGLDAKDVSHHLSLRRASILVPIFFQDTEPHLLLTQRPLHLTSHPGEVCFPGGKQDTQDGGNDVHTALRETTEEVGISAESIQVLCRLATIESLHHLCVTPIVGYIENAASMLQQNELLVNPTEVQAVFSAPLALFLRPPWKQFAVEWSRETFIMRHYRHSYKHSASAKRQVYSITGLTAHVANQVAQVVFGNSTPVAAITTTPTTVVTTKVPPTATTAATATAATTTHSGDVWLQQQSSSGRTYWSRRYLVLQDSSLHLYDTYSQAQRKANSANKKNRVMLRHDDLYCQAVSPNVSVDKKVFVVRVLSGQVEWTLAVATSEERSKWIEMIQKAAAESNTRL